MVYHGNYVVLATFLLNFVALGTFYSSAVFVVPLETTFQSSGRGVIDFFPSILLSAALFSSLGAGRLQGVFSKRGMTIEPLFAIGGMCVGLGLAYSSIAYVLRGVILGAVITGIGIGLTGFTAAGICVLWFDRNRGTVLLMAMAGSGLGNVAYSLGMQALINSFGDDYADPWRPAMRVGGTISLLISLGSSLAMRLPNPGEVKKHEFPDDDDDGNDQEVEALLFSEMYETKEPTAKTSLRPLEISLPQYPHHPSTRRNTTGVLRSPVSTLGKSLSETLQTRASVQPLPGNPRGLPMKTPGLPHLSLREVIHTRTTKSLLLWCFVSSFGFTSAFVHIPAFAVSVGLSPDEGAQALSLTGLGMLVGNFTLGRITDMIGPVRSLQTTMSMLVVLMLIGPHCVSPASLKTLGFLYGYYAAAQPSVPLIIMADAFGETSPDSILTLLGILNVAKFPGYLSGPTIVGVLFEDFGNYIWACAFAGTAMFIGNMFLFCIPSTEEQNKILMEQHKEKASSLLICDGDARVDIPSESEEDWNDNEITDRSGDSKGRVTTVLSKDESAFETIR